MPYVRQNRRSRWREDSTGMRAQNYNNYKALLRDLLAITMKQQGIQMFPEVPLWVKADFYLKSRKQLFRVDVDNLLKSCLDCCNSILITDDRWVIDAHCKKRYDNGIEKVIFAIGEL